MDLRTEGVRTRNVSKHGFQSGNATSTPHNQSQREESKGTKQLVSEESKGVSDDVGQKGDLINRRPRWRADSLQDAS